MFCPVKLKWAVTLKKITGEGLKKNFISLGTKTDHLLKVNDFVELDKFTKYLNLCGQRHDLCGL